MFLSVIAFSQKGNGTGHFFLRGKFTGEQKGILYLLYNDKGKQVKDSCVIRNDSFYFTGILDEPVKASLELKEDGKKEIHVVGFYLDPAKMKIKVPLDDFRKSIVSGSITNNESLRNAEAVNRISSRYKPLLDSVNHENDPDKQEILNQQLAPYYRELDSYFFSFYLEHPNSYLTPFSIRLLLRRLPIDSIMIFYNNMTSAVKSSKDGKIVAQEIELLKNGSPGSKTDNFTKNDINGNTLSLVNFRGKYVLLDFWASWCIPCRKANPHLIKLYNHYKEKGFEIIGVSDDDRNPAAWRNAVAKDSLPWLHILRGFDRQKKINEERNKNDINETFGIHTLPTQILIDPNGIIIGRFVENDKALDLILKKIFNE